jgi:hypothetical protein
MTDLAELARRVSLVENEVEGEKRVSRHILRKATENETLLLDVKASVSRLEDELTLLRADLPGLISTAVGALLREQAERK